MGFHLFVPDHYCCSWTLVLLHTTGSGGFKLNAQLPYDSKCAWVEAAKACRHTSEIGSCHEHSAPQGPSSSFI